MSYTPDATNASQPTGNVQLSTAAAEFRAIKQRIIDIATAQDIRDDAQDTAIGAAQSTANTGVSNAAAAQGTANTGVSNAAAAQGTANAGIANAAAAQGTANAAAAVASAALSGSIKSLPQQFTSSGSVTIPTGATTCLAFGRGGDAAFAVPAVGYASLLERAADGIAITNVTAGSTLTVTIGAVGTGGASGGASSFNGTTFAGAIPNLIATSAATGDAASARGGALTLIFY